MCNIVLIGMPASGKSTVGVLLAKTLGVGFCDTDLLIQQREHRLLQQIIDEDGIEAFLDAERDAILSLDCSDMVIATGGSAVLRAEAMQKLKANGVVVFLDVPLDEVHEVALDKQHLFLGELRLYERDAAFGEISLGDEAGFF